MGKPLISQRRGKGSATYRAPSHNFVADTRHARVGDALQAQVLDLITSPAHSAPLMVLRYTDNSIGFSIAAEGIMVGSAIETNTAANHIGNTLKLQDIPEGTSVFNIEAQPGDGGKFIKSSGTAGKILAKQNKKVIVIMPSKKQKVFSPLCRATIGVVAGGGRTEKPLLKAGNNYHKSRATNKLYPRTSGVAMNAVDHPYGCKRSSRKGRPTIAPRNAPPGAKVGKLRPRRTGRRKGA